MTHKLQKRISEYIGFSPNEIRPPITKEDKQMYRKIITDQEQITDLVKDEYQHLLRTGYNYDGGDVIHIAWLCAIINSVCEKVLVQIPHNIINRILTHVEKRFEGIPFAPILII